MTDEQVEAVHDRLLRVAGVLRVYPPERTPAALLRAAGQRAGLLDAVVEATVGLDGAQPAPATAQAAIAAVRERLPETTRVRIRIASID